MELPKTLEGTVEGTIFRNSENGYSVVEIKTLGKKETVTVVGTLPELAQGEQIALTGEWTEHPQYGRQWKAATCEIKQPSSKLGIERYLSSGLIKGIGKVTAHQIVEKFGKETLEIMGEHPERLAEIPGIGKKRAAMIAQKYQEQYAVREAMVFLQSYGISPALAMKISKAYGANAPQKIKENPYRMITDVEGVGFQTADTIALQLGIPRDGEARVSAGIQYILEDAANSEGHTCLPREWLNQRAAELLDVPLELVLHCVDRLLFSRVLMARDHPAGEVLMLSGLYYAERDIARCLLLLQSRGKPAAGDYEARVNEFEYANQISLSPRQRQAVTEAAQHSLMVITGGPGTGKTTIINCILSLVGKGAALAAPTGRAAKRMSEATGCEAKTIHRLLEYSAEEGTFLRNDQNPLEAACVIVDEMSMVDVYLMRSLLRALRSGTRLILVGDADQLPSVGAGNVLGDILQSGAVPSVRLTDIFRQSEESQIVLNAHRINQGEQPILNRKGSDFFFQRTATPEETTNTIVDLCFRRLPGFLNSRDRLRDIQVLAPFKKTSTGVWALNAALQERMNPPKANKPELQYGDTTFRLGDKVMHIRNDYQMAWVDGQGEDGLGVFNGDMGFIIALSAEEKCLTVRFDDDRTVDYEYGQLDELELAYCLSVHKSQGSEFPCVVMPVLGGPPRLLTRNLFYTAITRAKSLVVLVGRENEIAAMVNNNHIATRYTTLRQQLTEK